MSAKLKRALKSNEFVLLVLLLAIILLFGALNPKFIRPVNLVQYLNQGVVLALLTFGLSATVITGNFDYSIGALTGFGTVIIALFLKNGMPIPFALLLSLGVMVLCGVLNGVVVGYLGIVGMLGTLGTSSLFYGIALVLTKGQAISGLPEAFKFFGKSDLGKLPFALVLLAILFVASQLLIGGSPWGRRLYLLGTSPKAARFSGINTRREVMLAHVYSAVMCFFGALILSSRMATGRADVANNYVLEAVSAAVFGGISIKGGEGSITGALLGVLIFTTLNSGFNMLNLSQYYRQVATGALLIMVLICRNYKTIFGRRG